VIFFFCLRTCSCYLKLGEWQTALHDPYQEPASICTILHYYKCATEYDKQWYKVCMYVCVHSCVCACVRSSLCVSVGMDVLCNIVISLV